MDRWEMHKARIRIKFWLLRQYLRVKWIFKRRYL